MFNNYDCNNQGTDPNLVHKDIHDANDNRDRFSSHEGNDVCVVEHALHNARDTVDSGDALGTHDRDGTLGDTPNVHDILDKSPVGASRTHVHNLRERLVAFREMK
jgi:hypothetical protein